MVYITALSIVLAISPSAMSKTAATVDFWPVISRFCKIALVWDVNASTGSQSNRMIDNNFSTSYAQ
jgi:hypothetical protein